MSRLKAVTYKAKELAVGWRTKVKAALRRASLDGE